MRGTLPRFRISCVILSLFQLMFILFFLTSAKARLDCHVHFEDKYQGLIANCMNRGLRSVPEDLPRSIVVLQLAGNKIKEVPANCFQRYNLLRELDLSENDLSRFEKESFNGLSRLLNLNLWRNRISMNSLTFPAEVFKPLRSLQYLYLNSSKIESNPGDFPDHVFEDLIQLRVLSMDTWPDRDHRTGISKLHSLESLSIVGGTYCHMTHIDNNSFVGLDKLSIISFDMHCLVNSMALNVSLPFKDLKRFAFHSPYSSHTSLSKVARLLRPYVGTNLSELDLSDIQSVRDFSHIDTTINKRTLSYVLDICVEKIDLSYNRIERISSNIIQDSLLFKCVKCLYLSHNHIKSDTSVLFQTYFFQNLEYMDFSFNTFSGSIKEPTKTYNGLDLSITCPPKLQTLILRQTGHMGRFCKCNITIYNCSHLHKLDISETWDYDDFKGYIRGASSLKHLNISHNIVTESFFSRIDISDNLETLIARGTILTFDFMKSEALFSMKMLNMIDLSSSGLANIPPQSLRRLQNLKHLILSENKFDNIPEELTEISSLEHLDLSYNVLRTIPSDIRSKLDHLTKDKYSFQLDFDGNIFMCSCNTLDFIMWLSETEVILDHNRNYSCIKDDGSMSDTKSFKKSYLQHWRKCIGQTWLFTSMAALFFMLLSLTTAFLIGKYVPKFEYFVLMTLGYKPEEPPRRKDAKYDGYICYADTKYSWPCQVLLQKLKRLDRDIRLYLPDLHEDVGGIKAESIIGAIGDSWKVVILISEDSFADEWFYFTVLSAVRLFSNSTITSRIILLYRDDTPEVRAKTPQFLVNVVSGNNVLRVQEDDEFFEQIYRLVMEDMGPDACF